MVMVYGYMVYGYGYKVYGYGYEVIGLYAMILIWWRETERRMRFGIHLNSRCLWLCNGEVFVTLTNLDDRLPALGAIALYLRIQEEAP